MEIRTDKMVEKNFEVGDFFHEVMRYYELVIDVTGDELTVLTKLGEIKKYTFDEYVKYCSYGSIKGFWLEFYVNSDVITNDIIRSYVNELSKGDLADKRDNNIYLILLKSEYDIFNTVEM